MSPLATTTDVAGYRIAVKGGRIYISEVDDHDTGLDVTRVTALAVTLRAAAQQAIRQSMADS